MNGQIFATAIMTVVFTAINIHSAYCWNTAAKGSTLLVTDLGQAVIAIHRAGYRALFCGLTALIVGCFF